MKIKAFIPFMAGLCFSVQAAVQPDETLPPALEDGAAAEDAVLPGTGSDAAVPQAYDISLRNGVDAAVAEALAECVRSRGGSVMSLGAAAAGETVNSAVIDGTTLHLTFDEAKVAALASGPAGRSGGQAAAGRDADSVLVLLINRGANNSLVADPDGDPLSSDLDRALSESGVRLIYPRLADDSDSELTDTAVSARDIQVLGAAAGRYGTGYYIAGEISTENDGSVRVSFDLGKPGGGTVGTFTQSGAQSAVVKEAAASAAALSQPAGGQPEEPVAASAGDTAESVTETASAGSANVLEPGAYPGLVRIAISGTSNIRDFRAIRYALVTFGYESSVRIRGYSPEGVILEIPTSGSPAILDGTLSHAAEFTKTGSWRFHYNASAGPAASGRGGIGPAPADRVTSDMFRAYSGEEPANSGANAD